MEGKTLSELVEIQRLLSKTRVEPTQEIPEDEYIDVTTLGDKGMVSIITPATGEHKAGTGSTGPR